MRVVVFSQNGRPTAVSFDPGACDGTQHANSKLHEGAIVDSMVRVPVANAARVVATVAFVALQASGAQASRLVPEVFPTVLREYVAYASGSHVSAYLSSLAAFRFSWEQVIRRVLWSGLRSLRAFQGAFQEVFQGFRQLSRACRLPSFTLPKIRATLLPIHQLGRALRNHSALISSPSQAHPWPSAPRRSYCGGAPCTLR